MERNLIYWTRLRCYYLNVLHFDGSELFEKHGIHFTAAPRSLEKSWGHLQDKDWSEAGL